MTITCSSLDSIQNTSFRQIATSIGKIAIVILFIVYGIIAAYGSSQGLSGAEPLTFSAKMLYDHYYGLIAFFVIYIAIVANKWATLPSNDSKAQATSTNLISPVGEEPMDKSAWKNPSPSKSLPDNFVKNKARSRKKVRTSSFSDASRSLIASANSSSYKNTKKERLAARTKLTSRVSSEPANITPSITHNSHSTTITLKMDTIYPALQKYSHAITRSADYPLDYHAENMNSEEVIQMRERFKEWNQRYRLGEGQMIELFTSNHPNFDRGFILKWFDDRSNCLRYTKIDCHEEDNSKIQEILENAGFKRIATLV